MSLTLTINSDASLQSALGELRDMYAQHHYIKLTAKTGKPRSLDPFEPKTHARGSDPVTSHMAAESIKEFAPTHCEAIFAALKEHGPMTADEISAKTGLLAHQVNKRLADMRRAAITYARGPKAMPNGEYRPSDSGRVERVWAAVSFS